MADEVSEISAEEGKTFYADSEEEAKALTIAYMMQRVNDEHEEIKRPSISFFQLFSGLILPLMLQASNLLVYFFLYRALWLVIPAATLIFSIFIKPTFILFVLLYQKFAPLSLRASCRFELDPENSFGTGRHHTTQLCLELLEKYVREGDSVIDLGCGSGIIFISALLLGAKNAVGVDISPDAAKISRRNARKNGIADERAEIYCGDAVADPELRAKVSRKYDIVAANIVADVLLNMKELFAETARQGGTLILSGIIDGRTDEVFSAMESLGFELIEQHHRDIWNAAAFKKI